MNRRIANLISRLRNGETFYITGDPNISMSEIAEIERLVGLLQIESVYGAEKGSPRAVYPLDLEKFIRGRK